MARHSIELHLKELIEYLGRDSVPSGHDLLKLWRRLMEMMQEEGWHSDDEWTTYCAKLIHHLHSFDPNGERFRFPSTRDGDPFDGVDIDIWGLCRAHWHVTNYCEALEAMVYESRA